MKVSIITATFNSEKFIRNCIDSVLNQCNSNIEYIIIDGGSKDNTISIVKEYGTRISHVVSEPDNGIYDAMNKGIGLATGDIIGILNSDDIYADDTIIQKVVNSFTTTDCDTLYGDLLYVKQNDLTRITRKWKSGHYNKRSFLFGWMPPHPTFFVKREVYQKYGTFNVALKSAADYEIMLRFLFKHNLKVSYLPHIMVKMREGGVSNANIKNRVNANREDRKAWN